MGTVVKDGKPAGEAGFYGSAINGSAGNKWANKIATIEIANDHVAFVKDGKTFDYCAICGDSMLSVTGIKDKTFAGSSVTQEGLTVKVGDDVLKEGTDYEVEYKDNVDAGTASLTIKALEGGSYKLSGDVTESFKIAKSAAKITKFTPGTKTYSAKKKTKKLAAKKTFKLSATALGGAKVTYAKKSGNKKITISKAGKVTVKKGLKKGTYTVKVKVNVAATANTNKGTIIKTFKVKVK